MNAGRLIGTLVPTTPDIEHAFFEPSAWTTNGRRHEGGVWAEVVKLAGSTVGRVGSLAIVVGISVLSGTMLVAASTNDPQLLAKLGPVADGDWNGFLLGAAQITGAGGLGGFAVVLAWIFGREFGDGTITGLFALPVRRSTIALAKLLVYGVWATSMSVLLAIVLLAVGTVAGLGPIDSQTWGTVSRQIALGIMSAAITVPVAWAATLSRSVLGGVSVAIGLVVVAQVSVLVGIGGWMPLAAPALWALSAGSAVSPVQLLLVVPYVMAAVLLTAASWRAMQLDR